MSEKINTNQKKSFHIGDILTVTHDRLVSPKGIGGCYEILNFMTNDNLYTHQLPRAARICKPVLLKQLPQLKDIDSAAVNKDNWREWLDEQINTYGEKLEISPLESCEWESCDPMQELVEMVGKDKVIEVSL